MAMVLRMSLTRKDFETLVSGGTVKYEPPKPAPQVEEVQVVLSDIGFPAMLSILKDAVEKK